MLIKVLIASGIILALLLGWLLVQSVARVFAQRHPEWGTAREEGQGCGAGCSCVNKEACKKA